MSDMTNAEIARALQTNRQDHEKFVTKEVHDVTIEGLRADVQELKATINKLVWGIVALFFTIVGQVIIDIASRGGS